MRATPTPEPADRSTARQRRRRPARLSRRARALVAGVAVIALLALAWGIGNQADDATSTTAASGGSTSLAAADKAAPPTADAGPVMASTTIAMREEADGSTASGLSTTAADAASAGSGSAPDAQLTSVQPKIVRTGSADLVVKQGTFDDAVAKVTSLATGVGGFVSASETTALGKDPRGSITLRVPVRSFDRTVAALRRIGTVAGVTTGSQDVTGEYTDVSARISALKAEREQILLVLDKATTVPDILSVRDRLSSVQAELEQLQGRQQLLDDQASLSTLTVNVREKGSASTPTTPEPERTGFAKLWHDSTDRFLDGARSIVLGLATLAPWLLLGAVAWLIGRAWWRRTGSADPHPGGSTPATAAD